MSLRTKLRATFAGFSHGKPGKHIKIIVVFGGDGSYSTVAYLASIMRRAGVTVGVAAPDYVRIGDETVKGSEHSKIISDPFRLQSLLAQMKKAGCEFALLDVGQSVPAHGFKGAPLHMVILRRCGDSRLAPPPDDFMQLLGLRPRLVVSNHDDPYFASLPKADPEASITFGADSNAECRIKAVQIHRKGSAVKLVVDHQTELSLATAMSGKQTVYSVTAAAAAAYLLQVAVGDIEAGIVRQPQLSFNFELLNPNRPYSIVLDNAMTPDGLADTLEVVRHFTQNRLVAVLSAAGQPVQLRQVMGEITGQMADRIIVTDGDWEPHENPQAVREQLLQGVIASGGDAKAEDIAGRQAALEKALGIARRGDTIVVCSIPSRLYRKHGANRLPWNDKTIMQEYLQI